MYQVFLCIKCKKEFIVLTECINNNSGHMSCPYCGSRNIKRTGKYTDLKQCMEHSSYKVDAGVVKQKR